MENYQTLTQASTGQKNKIRLEKQFWGPQESQLLRGQSGSILCAAVPWPGRAALGGSGDGAGSCPARRLPDCQTSSAADSGVIKANWLLPFV